MTIRHSRLIPLFGAMLLLSAGACKKYDGGKAASAREEWLASLQDSITQIRLAQKEDSARIVSMREEIATEMSRFTQVANQREVAPYYILSSVRNQYPLTSTGIIARVTNDMQFEVIAALSGQKFDAIRIRKTSSPDGAVNSTVVPPDQALNYTSNDGLSVAAFSGELNSPLGKFVAENIGTPLSVEYLMNGSVRKTVVISEERKNCLASTWRFTSSRSMLDSLENTQILNARKLEILHITLTRQADRK